MKKFKVLKDYPYPILSNIRFAPDYIPWKMIEPHREQAMKNHDQTLERLNERGGLSPMELYAVIHDRDCFEVMKEMTESFCIEWLNKKLKEI